ncbi:hypothetical protein QYZ44_17670 [Vibrio parahaemolyticus]|nr:hypothetical protein [Vibrio parahaemolyticus]
MATQLSLSSGLRAHELLTLQPREIRAPDQRPALTSKWTGRDGVIYTVEGKGGLVREVLIPSHLAERLENLRLPSLFASRIVAFITPHTTLSQAAKNGVIRFLRHQNGFWDGQRVRMDYDTVTLKKECTSYKKPDSIVI